MPKKTNKQTEAKSYNHGEEHPQRPDIGTEPHFKKKKPPVTYRFDILAAVKRTAIPKPHDLGFCFFPEGFFAPALTDLLCSGLMVALQTDTASPAA
ncbi:hypothetical protein IQ242_24305, partial [Microcystis sp. LEGE 08355]|nr:hypothetical protein [Microcystis sp. LEGE 08355]